MTRSALFGWSLAAGLLVLPVRPAAADDVRAAVEAGNRAFVTAFLAGDARAVAELYTDDARVVAPGSPPAGGRAEIEAFWRGVIASGVKDVALTTASVEASGGLAVEDGTVRLVAADGTVNEDRYVVVWKRLDGRWRLHRDIWN
jgi:uncharacterized protein (TIGR02246 family)